MPLLRGVPGGSRGKLRIKFRVFPHTDRSQPALEPVVGAEGGPGYPSIDSAASYLFLLGPLRRRHDLIVVDNRGTGRSGAINCPRLQAGTGVYTLEVGRCARRLGRAANAYGTGAAADDLAAVLDRLGVPVVNIYGDSYGTYFAQAFAVRHPARVRAVVLDAAFGVDGYDPWIREESVALRFAWPEVCRRSVGCEGDVLTTLRGCPRASRRARWWEPRSMPTERPTGSGWTAPRSPRCPATARTTTRSTVTSWPRSARSSAATASPCCAWRPRTCPSPAAVRWKTYSEGAYAAVACHDYPTLWNRSAPRPPARAQLAAARSTLAPDTYYPFPNDVWLSSLYIDQYVSGCLDWPAPRRPDPPVPAGAIVPGRTGARARRRSRPDHSTRRLSAARRPCSPTPSS